ncbi:KRAB-A domain-containing protein 2, partial [Trichinella sp. T9]
LIKENGQNATIFLTLQHVQIIIGSIGIELGVPKYIHWSSIMKLDAFPLLKKCFMLSMLTKTFREALNKWTNVTAEMGHLLFPFSVECRKKKMRKLPKSLVVKPVIITFVLSRAQVTISVYPLKVKRAEEVATKMLEIFLMSSAPSILQSDSNQEFSNAIIVKLKTCWPELRLVSGRPQHPQSHGAVERLNGVVQDKSTILM